MDFYKKEIENTIERYKLTRKQVIEGILRVKRRNRVFQCLMQNVGRGMKEALCRLYVKDNNN